jgi:hypothetical protein
VTALDDRTTTRTTGDPHQPWRLRAACNGAPIEIFFPTRSNSIDANRAAAWCRHCTVTDHCEADAIAGGCRTFGVWAGRFWDEGRDRPITKPQGQPVDERIAAARQRRREALAQWLRIRPGYHSDHAASHALAAQYGVTGDTAKAWIKRARAEAAADYLAAKAGHDTDTDERH